MAVVRRATDKDATWARAWTADTAADLALISGARHGDVAYVADEARWYNWRDDDTWEPGGVLYEEGAWTPIFSGQTTPGTFTYSTQLGEYVRVGRLITLTFNIAATVSVAPTGNLQITGLPYSASTTLRSGQMVSVYSGFTLAAGYQAFSVNASGSKLELVKSGSGLAATNVPATELGASFFLRGTLSYLPL